MIPTAAVVVLLGFLPLHVVPEVEAQAGIYRPRCNHQLKLKSINYGHTKKSQDMEYEPILLSGTDKMIQIYAYHKPFKVQFPNKHEQQNGFNPDNMEAWSGIQMGPESMKALVLERTNGAQKGAQLQSSAPQHGIPGRNICHQGMHNGEYRKGVER